MKVAKFYSRTGWKDRGKGVNVCGGDETTGAYFKGKELGEIARGFKVRDKRGIAVSFMGAYIRDVRFKKDS